MSTATNVSCELETAPLTGNPHHIVRWTDANGEQQSQSIHCCEDDIEAVYSVLGSSIGEQYEADHK